MKAKVKLEHFCQMSRHKYYDCGCVSGIATCPEAVRLWERVTSLYHQGVGLYSPQYIYAKRDYSAHFNGPYTIR